MAGLSRHRQLRAWRRGFDLAVEVFRLTGRLEDARTNGFATRLRRAALRVPALVTRAAGRPDRHACAADLRAARAALAQLAADLPILRALVYSDPSEIACLESGVAATRGELDELERRVAANRAGRPAVEGGGTEV